jgi:hypothetical protein
MVAALNGRGSPALEVYSDGVERRACALGGDRYGNLSLELVASGRSSVASKIRAGLGWQLRAKSSKLEAKV